MGNDLIVRDDLPAKESSGSLSGVVFGRGPVKVIKRATIFVATLGFLYFGVLGNMMHRVDASLDFTPPNPVTGGSNAVSMAEALIARETVTHRWTPNDPVFFPTGFHDNMPNFQRGIMRAVSRFAMELENQIGRVRGASAIDNDLQRAAGLLQFPTDTWIFDLDQGLMPVQPADTQFRAAMANLRTYNERVAAGQAAFEVRADALALVLERMVDELNSRAAVIDAHVSRDGFIIDTVADDIFFFNKGQTYASYLLLREMGVDFERVIVAAGLQALWSQAMESLRQASQLHPTIVLNASGANSFFANHLHLQGFYIKRAVLQLDDVVRVVRAAR